MTVWVITIMILGHKQCLAVIPVSWSRPRPFLDGFSRTDSGPGRPGVLERLE